MDDRRVGIVGYGRFGGALANLAADTGRQVVAFDPTAEVPEDRRASGVDDLAARASIVVLAVPVAATRSALDRLRPHLGGRHLVIDTGSVKRGPMDAMAEVLGDDVGWCGTHPLFGPTSLHLGERPLRVVVCPARPGDAASARARALFEELGCRILESTADEHDRAMAASHALAYFVAKGLVDAGVSIDPEIAPPSALAIARTVEAVRADAGHLFVTLHRDNPFAADVRRRFLGALAQVDRTLAATPDPTPGDDPKADADADAALAIPDLGKRSPEIREVRDLIDEVDEEIVALLARRARLARRVGAAKAGLGVGVLDPGREARVFADRRTWATREGLDPGRVEEIFRAIVRFARDLQSGDGPE
jgi:prephenate dehydrogenase